MLFITDRIKEVQIKQGEVVKLSLLHEVCNFHNEGTQPALIQRSTNGYDWKALITVEPDSTTPISMDADTLYVRLVSKTVVNLKAIKPIPRNQAPQAPVIHSPSVLVKEDLDRYVTIQFLNDLIAQLPKTDTLTRDEILALIPEPTQLPDLSGYALKSDLQTDDIIAAIDVLTQIVLELKANNQDPELMNAISMLDMSVRYMEETKADATTLQNALSAFERLMESHQKTQEKVTGLSSTIAQQASTEALERMVERLRVLIDTRATMDDLDALTDTVEHKASIDWVAQNTNFILGLIQDKANKVYVDELYKRIRLISAIINMNDDEPFSADGFKQEIIQASFNKVMHSDEYQALNQISLQNQEDVTVLRSDVDEHKVFTGFVKDIDLLTKVETLLI